MRSCDICLKVWPTLQGESRDDSAKDPKPSLSSGPLSSCWCPHWPNPAGNQRPREPLVPHAGQLRGHRAGWTGTRGTLRGK